MEQTDKKEFLFECVYIETPVDTDGDGKLDLIAAYIRRPKETLEGSQVPAILVANPYLMTCNEDWYIPHNVNQKVKVYPQQNIREEDIRFDFTKEIRYEAKYPRQTQGYAKTAIIPEDVTFECISELYEHLNQLGYASVFCGGLGTRGSEGFTLSGSREEIMAFCAVIDWLCGRCRAFTNKTDNIEIKADWCTGSVAMSAKSYLGTMCIGVAATGIEGLKTILPEAGICNWYSYYRCGGLNLPALEWQGDDLDILARYCFSRAKDEADYATVKDGYQAALEELVAKEDRDSANYNRFWDERNYLNQIENFKASVFIIHGINDWNVKTNQCIPLFQALERQGVERKMLLHQGEHIYVYRLADSNSLEMIERWLDHYLRGADNGIEQEAKVLVESNLDQASWMASDTWPPAGWQYVDFPVDASSLHEHTGRTAVIVDDLKATVYDWDKDNQAEWLKELVLCTSPSYQNRLKLVWSPDFTTDSLRIAGAVTVSFDASIDQETAIFSVMLVDLGEQRRITPEQIPVEAAPEGTFRFRLEEAPSAFKVISRGWLNAQNRSCLYAKERIEPGQFYHYQLQMVPTDHSLPKGHQLGFLLYGIDAQQTQRPDTVTRITVDLDSLKIQVPIVP